MALARQAIFKMNMGHHTHEHQFTTPGCPSPCHGPGAHLQANLKITGIRYLLLSYLGLTIFLLFSALFQV